MSSSLQHLAHLMHTSLVLRVCLIKLKAARCINRILRCFREGVLRELKHPRPRFLRLQTKLQC